ncbi:MAG: C39 family peptidase [Phycisphaerales bacterium]
MIRLVLLVVALGPALVGCASVRLPEWHHTVIFIGDRSSVEDSDTSIVTPVDFSPEPTPSGRWVVRTPPVSTGRFDGFDEALIAWNIDLEPGAAATIDVIVDPGSLHAPPDALRVGFAGDHRCLPPGDRVLSTDDGTVRIDVDYLRSGAPLRTIQVQVEFFPPKGVTAETPPGRVDRLSVCMSRTLLRRLCRTDEVIGPVRRTRSINLVPFRPQSTEDPVLSGRLCSPASLAMVLAFHGVDRRVGDLAAMVRDPDEDLYGNWPRNIQAAYELGVPGFLTRFNSWEPVADHLSRGEPIIASIRAPRGVLRGAPYQQLTGGHLIVLTGLDGRGGVYVNDPAAGTALKGQRVYSMRDLTRAWMELANGTSYVLLKPSVSTPVSPRSKP